MNSTSHQGVSEDLTSKLLEGNRRAAGRIISLIEDGDAHADEIVRTIYPSTGDAYLVGFTGPPGAGKSTLVDDVVHIARGQGNRVGVIAVDPNSPFSGGAILGDRIRMMRHTVDSDVFIRSMGSRGHLGGLAEATSRAAYVLDAMGMDAVFLETVGVGQSELEVAELADTTIVVLMPGLGDGVQTIKAGIMEIADIFVVNKADHPAVNKTVADLKDLLRLDERPRDWTPPILKCVATSEEGVPELWEAVANHREFLESSGLLMAKRAKRLERQILDIATERLRAKVVSSSMHGEVFQSMLREVVARRIDPFSAAEQLLAATPD